MAAGSELAELQRDLFDQVPMLRGPKARAYNEALGEQKDAYLAQLRAAIKARWTSGARMRRVAQEIGAQLDDATLDDQRLRLIGLGFGLPRLGSMTNIAYQDYLDRAWDIWEQGGTCAAIIDAVQAFGVPDVYVWEEWEGALAAPGAPYAKRLSLILGPDYGALGWTGTALGANFVLGASSLGLTGISEAQVSDIIRLFRKWKDAEALMVEIIFLIDGEAPLLGYNFTLGSSALGGAAGQGVAVRPITSQDALGNFVLGRTLLGVNYLI
jgi:hypothetical protein